jgi:hypothetical protein
MLYLLMKGAKEEGHNIHSHVPVTLRLSFLCNTRRKNRNNSHATPEYGKVMVRSVVRKNRRRFVNKTLTRKNMRQQVGHR